MSPLPSGLFHRARKLMGLDFHVLMTLLFRSWSVVAGAATVLVVPLFLSQVEQGYYYTFAGILGLQIFFELGLSQVIVQLVGHQIAHLRSTGTQLEGEASRIDHLSSLVQLLRRWYGCAALLFAVLGGTAGALFFHERGQLPPGDWMLVWLTLTLSTSVNLVYMPALAMMEGTGQMGQVARLRLIQSAVGYAGLWIVLMTGGRLWAAAAMPVASAVISGLWLHHKGDLYRWLQRRPFQAAHRINWRQDVLPFQWRIAASWLSGYFIFYAFTPLVFVNQGVVEAGRFGMAMTVFNSISAIGMSWVNAKSPAFGMHISRGERQALNALFVSVFSRSVAFTTLASLAVVAVCYALWYAQAPFANRIADPTVIAALGMVCIINCVIFSVATYMRAHREEPMLPVSAASGAATALIAYFGSKDSVLLMSVCYMVMNLFIALPWSIHLFLRYFRRAA